MRSSRILASAALVAVAAGTLAANALTGTPASSTPERVVFTENFDGPALPAGFTPVSGSWSVRDGRLVVDGGAISRITFGPHLTNYRFEATVRFDRVANASRWAGLILDIDRTGSVPWWHGVMRSQSTAANGVEIAQRTVGNQWNVPYAGSAPSDAATGRDVALRADVQGGKTTWYFNGTKVLEGRIDRSQNGVLGFVADNSTVSFDNVKVTEIAPESLVVGDGNLPVTIGHRGYSQVNPENSLAALVASGRSGAEYMETDVHTSRDGVPVVMHDQTVDRTTPGTGDVATLTGSAIIALEVGSWFDPVFADQKVPTLQQVLDITKRGRSQLLLEIKGPETDAEVARMMQMIRDTGVTDRVIVQSFSTDVLVSARKHHPDIRLGLLRSALDADPVAVAKQYDVVAYNPSFGGLRVRPDVVSALHDAGVAVMPWTVDSARDWQTLVDWKVDGVITNRPGGFIGWKQAVEAIPAPAKPTVAVVSPKDGSGIERGGNVVIAASATDATTIAITLDGRPVEQGAVIPASDLAIGEHTVRVTATGPGGTTDATSTFRVTVTPAGLRGRIAQLDVSTGRLQQMLTALAEGNWNRLEALVERLVDDPATATRLTEEIAALRVG